MTSVNKISLQDFVAKIVLLYKNLLGESWIDGLNDEEIVKRIDVLRRIAGLNESNVDNFSDEERMYFLDAILSAYAIASSTESDDLDLNKVENLGPKREIKGKFKAKDREEISRWYFSLLIQGWYQAKTKESLKDLDFDSSLNGKRCDFKIPNSNGGIDLIECKKINPGRGTGISDISQMSEKIIYDVLPIATQQLNSTEKQMDSIATKNIFIDITSYKLNNLNLLPNPSSTTHAYGFSEDEVVEIKNILLHQELEGVDNIILCWNNYLFIDGAPRALTQSSTIINFSRKIGMPAYEGWTVEAHPMNSSVGIREIRISSTARSWGWIETTFNNLSDPSSFWLPK